MQRCCRSDGQLSVCEGMHYRLVALHIRIQTAAAYEAMGKWQEAEQMLTQAILEAETDYLMLPFVENYRYLKKLLLRCQKQESLFVRYLIQMGEMYEMRRECLRKEAHRPEVLAVLTDKEYEMVRSLISIKRTGKSRRKCSFQKEVSNNMSNRFIQNFRLKGIPEQRESSCYSCWKRIPNYW